MNQQNEAQQGQMEQQPERKRAQSVLPPQIFITSQCSQRASGTVTEKWQSLGLCRTELYSRRDQSQ